MIRIFGMVLIVGCIAGVFISMSRGQSAPQSSESKLAVAASSTSVTVTDALGRSVTVAAAPQRIVCLVSFASEMLLALDVRPILRPKIPAEYLYPPEAAAIPEFNVDHTAGPDIESLAAVKPDLIFVSPIFARFIEPLEERLRVPVICVKIDDVTQIPDLVTMLGRVTRREQKAAEIAERHRAEMARCTANVPANGPKVAALFGTPQSFLGFLPESYLGSLLRGLNCQLATANSQLDSAAKRQTAPFSLEKLIAADPDAILLVQHEHGDPSAAVKAVLNDPVWKNLRAVKEGRVHTLSAWLVLSNPGLRAPHAQAQLKELLFPKSPGAILTEPKLSADETGASLHVRAR